MAALEKSSGAHIGVAAIDMGNGNAVFYRESERFLMCSTAKLMLTAATLARIDAGEEKAGRLVRYSKIDLLGASPATTRNIATGMSVAGLCEAAIIYSDNAAANLLLAALGGPAAYTAFLRTLGDTTSRLDRNEPALNVADGDKDTTTPSAMMADMKMVLLGTVLTPGSRQKLLAWLSASKTGATRLRAGLPRDWQVGDKTGTGATTRGDLAIATPPGRKPILIAAYVRGGNGADADRDGIFADIGRIVAGAL